MENSIEIWKDIKGFEGRYLISTRGSVKSLRNRSGNYKAGFILLKPRKEVKGYLQYPLYKDGKCFPMKAHRLVLNAFVGESNLEVNHINGIRNDNRIENLEWVTIRENNCHKNNKNKYTHLIGAHFDKGRNKWSSSINIEGKIKFLGRFESDIEAHNAYMDCLKENNIANKYAELK